MTTPIPAIIMTPPADLSRAEQWMARGRRAAALDLVSLLCSHEAIDPVYVLAADDQDGQALSQAGGVLLQSAKGEFHFGQALARIVDQAELEHMAYFGGASAPLLNDQLLHQAVALLLADSQPRAVVNNRHSTDWALLNHAPMLAKLTERLPADNPLGWVLEREAGFDVHALDACAATRFDLDTPADFVLLLDHPQIGNRMRDFLSNVPGILKQRVDALRQVLTSEGNTLIVIGRSSSDVWAQLERRAQIWVRMFVEERGMTASGRLARGEVRSLLAELLEEVGPEVFVEELSSLGDAVLWDTRVWMAHRGGFPSSADRFAADLGWEDEIDDARLRRLTRVVNQAAIPILTGGHGVVSGGVYALLER